MTIKLISRLLILKERTPRYQKMDNVIEKVGEITTTTEIMHCTTQQTKSKQQTRMI